jgi:uncharacterized phiE125 gp8 family phage protein
MAPSTPLLVRTAAPAELPIDREMVWEHLRTIPADEGGSPIDLAPEDAAYLDELISAAVDRLDGPQGLLNRALITQTWQARLSCFCLELRIPLARCQSVTAVQYLDTAGVEQTLAPSAYRVTGLLTDECRIRPATGTSWPSTLADPEAVKVTFVSGFGDAPEHVPGSLRHALLEMVATAYEHRESVVVGSSFSVLPQSASRAAQDWVVWPT